MSRALIVGWVVEFRYEQTPEESIRDLHVEEPPSAPGAVIDAGRTGDTVTVIGQLHFEWRDDAGTLYDWGATHHAVELQTGGDPAAALWALADELRHNDSGDLTIDLQRSGLDPAWSVPPARRLELDVALADRLGLPQALTLD